jgi:hypothetical protein
LGVVDLVAMPFKLDPRFRIATLGMSSVFILAAGDEVHAAPKAATAASGASGSGATEAAGGKSKKQLKREAKGPVKEKKEKPVRTFVEFGELRRPALKCYERQSVWLTRSFWRTLRLLVLLRRRKKRRRRLKRLCLRIRRLLAKRRVRGVSFLRRGRKVFANQRCVSRVSWPARYVSAHVEGVSSASRGSRME